MNKPSKPAIVICSSFIKFAHLQYTECTLLFPKYGMAHLQYIECTLLFPRYGMAHLQNLSNVLLIHQSIALQICELIA